MRRLLATVATAGLLIGAGSAHAAKPTVGILWEDPAGDADAAQGLGQSIPAWFDLASGAIAKNGANLDFIVGHADMPPIGSLPEGARFLWAFSVDGVSYRITAKSADIGKPDVLANETDERVGSVSPTGHFRIEGECATGATVGVLSPINCKPLAYVEGAFNPGDLTITVNVPMALVKAKTGSKITIGSGDALGICSVCWVSHAAERSLQNTIIDSATWTTTYKVPKK